MVRVTAGNSSSVQPKASKKGTYGGQRAPRNCPGLCSCLMSILAMAQKDEACCELQQAYGFCER